ncbi:MAG: N-acetylmuramoyl-L-alanine amidase [Eubacterium sp.]|nr:N-acetylmuramoyl-L-alanine amidase [Eubacterium sp.]
MKKLLVIIFTFVFTFVSCVGINYLMQETVETNSNANHNRVNLVIDAGHGGIDAGTIGVDSTKEKGINLDIALKLYDFAMVSGIPAFLVRDGDYLVYNENDDKSRSDLYNRMDYINSINNSTLISIHQNHFEDEREWGMQVWYSPNDDKSKIIADNILNITKANLQKDNTRLNKRSDSSYYLLYKAKVPSVMVECGFMSNSAENKKLQDDQYQKQLAYSIMLGFSEYLTKEL